MSNRLERFKAWVESPDTPDINLVRHILAYNKASVKARGTANIKIKIILNEFYRRVIDDDDLTELFNGLKEQGIADDLILHMYILKFLGYYIPRRSKCRDHIAPFKFISDMFFERVINSIAFANRTGGKTLCVAILNQLDMTFKDNCEVCTAGATLEQAQKGYDYLKDFHYGSDILWELLKKIGDRTKEPIQSRTEYENGSKTKIITASYKGLNSQHPEKARIDEIELIEGGWDVLQQGLSMAKSSKDILGQMVFSSTRKHGDGVMQRLLNKADDHNKKFPFKILPHFWKVHKWCIWETVERCTRQCKGDKKYGDCPAYHLCKGRARQVPGGWYPILDFIAKVATMDAETFKTEWLNQKPGGSVFVYGDYWSRDHHIIGRLEDLEEDIYYVGGIDFGTSPGHDWVFQGYKVDVAAFRKEVEESEPGDIINAKMTFYLDYEYRNSGKKTLESHANMIKAWEHFSEDLPIFADPSAAQERVELEGLGVFTTEAINDVKSGISLVKSHLYIVDGVSHFYIFDDYFHCEDIELLDTALEFERYRFQRTPDGKPNPDKPLKVYDHGMDVSRYVIQSSIPYFQDLFTVLIEEIEQDGFFFSNSRTYWDERE